MELTESIVEHASAGDPDAISTIYRVLSPKVLGYLTARGVDDPEALTSEVFLGVIPRLPGLRGGVAGLRTLVFSVAHARYVDETRRRVRRPTEVPYDDHDDRRTTPSAESEAMDRTGQLAALLDRLGEDQRTVISLRILADLSLEETAAVVGRSTGAVKQLQRRGLERLRSLLVEQDPDKGRG